MKSALKILILLACLLPVRLLAQDCNYELKEKDKFTGKTTVGYYYSISGHLWYMRKLDTLITFELSTLSFNGAIQQGVDKGTVAQFRLANGEFISLVVRENAAPLLKAGTNQVYSTFRVFFDISAADMLKLSQSAPVAMKVPLGTVSINTDIPEKKGEKMRAAAKCLIDYKG